MRYLFASLLFIACGFVVFLGGSAAIGSVFGWAKGSGVSLREYEIGGWVAIALLLALLLRFGGMAFFGGSPEADLDAPASHHTPDSQP